MTRRLLSAGALLAAALAAATLLIRVLRPPNVRIADPEGPPTLDRSGRARSIQAAELTIPPAALAAVWSPAGLERLGRTYWRFLARATLGLIRVVDTPGGSQIVLLARPAVLLAFDPAERHLDDDRGVISWPIRGGLLAARPSPAAPLPAADPGVLRIELRRLETTPAGRATLRVEVAVVAFLPSIARRFGPIFYARTQARIHVILSHMFMRSLARMRLAPPPTDAAGAPGRRPPGRSTAGPLDPGTTAPEYLDDSL